MPMPTPIVVILTLLIVKLLVLAGEDSFLLSVKRSKPNFEMNDNERRSTPIENGPRRGSWR